jgi:transposase
MLLECCGLQYAHRPSWDSAGWPSPIGVIPSSHGSTTPHIPPPRVRLARRPTRPTVLALVEAGRPLKRVAEVFGISDLTVCNWRRQHLIDTGQVPGIPSSENAEVIAARRRIAELVEIFHNRQRRHPALGMLTPIEYELRGPNLKAVA